MCQSKNKSSTTIASTASSASPRSTKQPFTTTVNDDHEWKAIYRSKIIIPAVLLCRCKIYQTFISISVSCYLIFLYMMEQIEKKVLLFGVGASIFALIMLFVAGNVFRKMIGFVYLNQDKTLVKLSHLTFWGQRKDIVYKLNNIMPLSDSNQSYVTKAMFAKIKFYDNEDEYFINLRYGGIIDKDKFRYAFGFYC